LPEVTPPTESLGFGLEPYGGIHLRARATSDEEQVGVTGVIRESTLHAMTQRGGEGQQPNRGRRAAGQTAQNKVQVNPHKYDVI